MLGKEGFFGLFIFTDGISIATLKRGGCERHSYEKEMQQDLPVFGLLKSIVCLTPRRERRLGFKEA